MWIPHVPVLCVCYSDTFRSDLAELRHATTKCANTGVQKSPHAITTGYYFARSTDTYTKSFGLRSDSSCDEKSRNAIWKQKCARKCKLNTRRINSFVIMDVNTWWHHVVIVYYVLAFPSLLASSNFIGCQSDSDWSEFDGELLNLKGWSSGVISRSARFVNDTRMSDETRARKKKNETIIRALRSHR